MLTAILFYFVVDVKFRLSPDEYEPFLSSDFKLQCTAYATVQETKQMWLGKATQCFAQSEIQFKFPSGFQYATVGMYVHASYFIIVMDNSRRTFHCNTGVC